MVWNSTCCWLNCPNAVFGVPFKIMAFEGRYEWNTNLELYNQIVSRWTNNKPKRNWETNRKHEERYIYIYRERESSTKPQTQFWFLLCWSETRNSWSKLLVCWRIRIHQLVWTNLPCVAGAIPPLVGYPVANSHMEKPMPFGEKSCGGFSISMSACQRLKHRTLW